MEEVENTGVEQPVAQEVADPTTETAQEVEIPTVEAQNEDRNDRNWRELRKSKEDWERKAKMQEEMLERLMRQQVQAHPEQAPIAEDIINELAKEEYVPGEKVAKGFQQLKQEFRKEIEEVKKTYASHHQNSLFNDLKREFPDFDDIVNPETIAILEETNPRLAMAIANSKDPYMVAVQSYEYIKAKGISGKAIPSKRAKEVEAKIEQNKKTVQTPQAFDKRPMAQAFQLTESMKKELQNEMLHFAQQAGMGY